MTNFDTHEPGPAALIVRRIEVTVGPDMAVNIRDVPHAEIISTLPAIPQPTPIKTYARTWDEGGPKTNIIRQWAASEVGGCRLCWSGCTAHPRRGEPDIYQCGVIAHREVGQTSAPLYEERADDVL